MEKMPADESQEDSQGTPQGGVISPLLANTNRYFKKLGFFCLLDSRETEFASLRNGENH